MRKIVFAFLLLSFIASCGPKDKNIPIVKKEFKAYVQNSFDDPSSLKEIVDIVPNDTISLDFMKALIDLTNTSIEQYRELWRLKDSVNTEQVQAIIKGPKPKRQPTYSEAIHGSELIDEYSSYLLKISEAKIALYSTQARLEALEKELVYHPAIYVYEIKYRNQLKDGLKLQAAYAYIDSLAGFKVIMPEKDDTSILSEDYNNVFQQSKECVIASDKVQYLYDKQKEKWDELMEYTQRFR